MSAGGASLVTRKPFAALDWARAASHSQVSETPWNATKATSTRGSCTPPNQAPLTSTTSAVAVSRAAFRDEECAAVLQHAAEAYQRSEDEQEIRDIPRRRLLGQQGEELAIGCNQHHELHQAVRAQRHVAGRIELHEIHVRIVRALGEARRYVNPPGACINCHASMVTVYNQVGNGDMFKGFELINHMKYKEARQYVKHPIACIDCHDPQSMQLRVTRPAFINGIRALKASQGVPDYDVNKMATRQEMRSYVCGQCHVTYYFKGPDKQLTFPWTKGLRVEDIIAHEDEAKVKEWEHPDTGAPLMKARHPEFEVWNMGVHARSGVACADCHMPYTRMGGLKISDHHVNSPLLKINRACQTCHHFPEEELRARAEDIQDHFFALRNTALDSLMDLIGDIKANKDKATAAQLTLARDAQRRGQFMIDFIMSENSMGFHAPQEAMRILGEAINLCRNGQVALHGGPVPSHTDVKPR